MTTPAPTATPAPPPQPGQAAPAFAVPAWAKGILVALGMGASGVAGVETGGAAQEARVAVLETQVSALQADNGMLRERLDKFDAEHSEGVHQVLCAVSDAHAKGFPGCGRGRL
jgi:hypothetical protein